MSIRTILFTVTALVFTNNYVIADTLKQKDFVFNEGPHTKIRGNDLWQYFRHYNQQNPSPIFKYIKVIEIKNKEFKIVGTLGSMDKLASALLVMAPMSDMDDATKANIRSAIKFEKHAAMNNAIYCDDVEQVEDYDGNKHSIGAIVYRTQDLNYCPLVKEYIAQQKAAEAETK
jgi:hypothetical protein